MQERAVICEAQQCLIAGNARRAITLAQPILNASATAGRLRTWVEASCVKAGALGALEQGQAGVRILVVAIERTAPLGMRRSVLDRVNLLRPLGPHIVQHLSEVEDDAGASATLCALAQAMNINVAERPSARADAADPLTARELRVLELAAEGLSNARIASSLAISLATVKTHLYNAFVKLNADNRVDAIARAHGFEASFMAKPYADRAGSGMHVHMSVAGPDGKNAFAAADPAGAPILRHAVGGLQRIMHEAMAVFAPTPNAYRRFVPNLFVPVNRHWGINNRSTGLRVPAGGPNSRRIEHRVSGADANPYLVMAALLAGLHHGLASKIDPGKPFEGNASELPDPSVPFNFPDALAAMEKSSVLRSYWGSYVDVYVATKRVELERFNAIIPPHEHDWYL